MSYFPLKANEYVEQFYGKQELFSISDMRQAFNHGKKAESLNTCANWVSTDHKPQPKPNQYVFILCFSLDDGVNVEKVLSSEFVDFIETHSEALYWCYEYRIAPKKIRRQFQEIKDNKS